MLFYADRDDWGRAGCGVNWCVTKEAKMRPLKNKPLWARVGALTCCFTLLVSGVLPPSLGMAQEQPVKLKYHKSHTIRNGVGVDAVGPAQVVSLKEVPVPVPMAAVIAGPIPGPGVNLAFKPLTSAIVKNQAALLRLGKALFWDMQVGSDGVQACATCHFNAGADIRSMNSISPGLKDANFHGPIGGDNSFGDSTIPYTANDPLSASPSEPPNPALNLPGHPAFRPNYQLTANDFPLQDWTIATELVPRGPGVTIFDEFLHAGDDTNDVVSSQGVRHTRFVSVTPGNVVDNGVPMSDVFNTVTPGQLNLSGRVRRVEPRNAPTVINAVFNFDNFWDGRASFVFNGVNPFGFRDQTSTLKENVGGVLTDVFLRVTNSSLASQSVGPPGSNFEMSWEGRSFPDIGKKMVSLRPLAKQLVHPTDSVLGTMSLAKLGRSGRLSGKGGLNVATYSDMVKAAFKDQWWNSAAPLAIVAGTRVVQKPTANDPRTIVVSPGKAIEVESSKPIKGGGAVAAVQYSQMEYNFSMFFGLAVQAYEATLVSDDTPFDRFMGAPSKGVPANSAALNDQQRLGLAVFMDANPNTGTKCDTCHILPVTTSHTVLDNQPDAQGVPDLSAGEAIETMIMGDNTSANYDHGMYNTADRRTSEDAGRAGTAPDAPPFRNALDGNRPFPLSLVELAALRNAGKLPPDVARFVPDTVLLDRRVTNGAFKASNLRNVKFTGPYFHNGDSATLRQTVEFYARGGNFPNTNFPDLAVDIAGIPPLQFPLFNPAADQEIQALVAFMAEGLTDQRVAFEKAPFDHPQLFIPNGAPANQTGADVLLQVPPVGKAGRATEIPTFLNLGPQSGGSILSH